MVELHHLGSEGVVCRGAAARPDTVVYSAYVPVCSRLSGLLCTGNRSPVGLCQLSGTLCRIPSLRSLPTSKPFSIRLTANPDVRHAFEVASSHDLVTSAMTHLRSVHSPRREWQDSNLRYASVCQNWSRPHCLPLYLSEVHSHVEFRPDACFGNQAGPESNRSHNTESSSTELPAWVITFSVLSYG